MAEQVSIGRYVWYGINRCHEIRQSTIDHAFFSGGGIGRFGGIVKLECFFYETAASFAGKGVELLPETGIGVILVCPCKVS